jgi:hypothetical protein
MLALREGVQIAQLFLFFASGMKTLFSGDRCLKANLPTQRPGDFLCTKIAFPP